MKELIERTIEKSVTSLRIMLREKPEKCGNAQNKERRHLLD
jgi:hypothetical protein